jgi:hypothetical protein
LYNLIGRSWVVVSILLHGFVDNCTWGAGMSHVFESSQGIVLAQVYGLFAFLARNNSFLKLLVFAVVKLLLCVEIVFVPVLWVWAEWHEGTLAREVKRLLWCKSYL